MCTQYISLKAGENADCSTCFFDLLFGPLLQEGYEIDLRFYAEPFVCASTVLCESGPLISSSWL